MECRLDQPSLAPVGLALACDESIAEELLRQLEAAAFGEVISVSDKNVSNVIRMIDEIDRRTKTEETNHVAVVAGGRGQESQGVSAKGNERPDRLILDSWR